MVCVGKIREKNLNLFIHLLLLQVEFPEARILEETLNILLYERLDSGIDPDSIPQVGGKLASIKAHSCQSDEDEDGHRGNDHRGVRNT